MDYEKKKNRKPVFSRMYLVNPRDRERFFFKLLLLHVKGARSFSDLRTFEDITYSTYREAAYVRQLTMNGTFGW